MTTEQRVGELPPCMSVTMFGDRAASMVDSQECTPSPHDELGFRFAVGRYTRLSEPRSGVAHPDYLYPDGTHVGGLLYTDDPDEAKAAYEKACEWVRTGETEEGSEG